MLTTTNSGIETEVNPNPLRSSKSIHSVKESLMSKNAPALSAEMLAILANSNTAELLALINAATTQVEPELAAMRAQVYANAVSVRSEHLAATALLLASKHVRNSAAANVAGFIAANKVASGQPMRRSDEQNALVSDIIATVPNPNNGERNITVLATSDLADEVREIVANAFDAICAAIDADERAHVTANAEKPEADADADADNVPEADATSGASA